MATTNIIDLVKGHCVLYKGGSENPYKPQEASGESWAKEYLKFNIWDAERAVVQNITWWKAQCIEQQPYVAQLSKAEQAEEIYKLAIRDKLAKMKSSEHDFQAMYFDLF